MPIFAAVHGPVTYCACLRSVTTFCSSSDRLDLSYSMPTPGSSKGQAPRSADPRNSCRKRKGLHSLVRRGVPAAWDLDIEWVRGEVTTHVRLRVTGTGGANSGGLGAGSGRLLTHSFFAVDMSYRNNNAEIGIGRAWWRARHSSQLKNR